MPRIATVEETVEMRKEAEKIEEANLRALVAMLPDGMPLPESLIERVTTLMGKE